MTDVQLTVVIVFSLTIFSYIPFCNNIHIMNPRWKHPFTAIIAGPTGSGKTVFTFNMIENAQEMIAPPPEKIIYCYGEYQQIFNNYTQVEFDEGLPSVSQFDGKQRVLLILDDRKQ